jgi:glycosyltransferase involved in cell wall biosynthesis
MKVLMVSREYPPFIVGGVARHTFYLTKHLRKKGALVKVVSFGDPKLNSEDTVFIEPRSSIISRDPKNVAEDAKVLFDIARFTSAVKSILKNEDFDILHVQEPYVGGLISFEYKVTTIHDTSFGEIKSYLKYLDSGSFRRLAFYISTGYAMELASIATSKVVINPSLDVAWEMIKIYKAPLKKLRVIPNGVEEPSTSEPDKLSCRRLLGLPEDHFILFSTAQHVGRKRLETIVKAAKILKDKGFKKFTAIIGGKGPLTKYLEELATNLGVQDVLKFSGWIHDEELPLYYRAADAFVISSEYEAGPITMLEAGIRGIPLIVSDVPSGLLMIARDCEHCLKFKLGDARDLAEKILTLSSDYGLWKKLAQGAKVFASAFRWDNVADKTIKVYKEVLSG